MLNGCHAAVKASWQSKELIAHTHADVSCQARGGYDQMHEGAAEVAKRMDSSPGGCSAGDAALHGLAGPVHSDAE